MKTIHIHLTVLLFILPVLAADPEESPRDAIRRQIQTFDAAVTTDAKLQTLLAERYEQNGNPAQAAPIFARLLADHRSPEHLRRYAAFLFRTGDIDQGTTLANQLTHEAKDGREPEALAQELLSLREWVATRDFLVPLLTQFPDDWRLGYLHACALELLSPDASAFAAFRSLITVHAEISDFITPNKDSTLSDFFDSPARQQDLSRLTPDEALASPGDSSSPVRFSNTKRHLIRPVTDDDSTKLTNISTALQAAVSTGDYIAAADLANQAILHYSKIHSRKPLFFPSFDSCEKQSDYLHRISRDSPKPFTPSEIIGLFQINGLIEALDDNGAAFFNAPSPKPSAVSPARLELLKILGEKSSTPESAPPQNLPSAILQNSLRRPTRSNPRSTVFLSSTPVNSRRSSDKLLLI